MTTKTSVRRLSDAELVNAQFRYTDPENTIVGLSRGIPDPEMHPVIVGYYDETPAGGRRANPTYPMVWCCHCGKPTHWKGRVLRDDRGEFYIIGALVCGRLHYGERFADAERAFSGERERRRTLIRWGNALRLLGNYCREVDAILSWPGLAATELKRGEIRRASPSGFKKLLRYIGTGTEMVAHYSVRDLAAEDERNRRYDEHLARFRKLPPAERRALRDDGLAPEPDDSQIWSRKSEQLGHLTGGEFLLESCDPRTRAIELRETLAAIALVDTRGTDVAETKDMVKLLQQLRDRTHAVRDAMHSLIFTELFFSSENLTRLERWSAHETQFSYVRFGTKLIVTDGASGKTIVDTIGKLESPDSETIFASHHLDDTFSYAESS